MVLKIRTSKDLKFGDWMQSASAQSDETKDSKTLVLVALLPTFLAKEKSRPPAAKRFEKRILRPFAAHGGEAGGKSKENK